jgi:hypothetical protein
MTTNTLPARRADFLCEGSTVIFPESWLAIDNKMKKMPATTRIVGSGVSFSVERTSCIPLSPPGWALTMKVGEFFRHRKRHWLRMHEMDGGSHEVSCHHTSISDGIPQCLDRSRPALTAARKGGYSQHSQARQAHQPPDGYQRCAADDQAGAKEPTCPIPPIHTFRAIPTYLAYAPV